MSKTITKKTIGHLFWGKFPYKVVLRSFDKTRRTEWGRYVYFSQNLYNRCDKYLKKLDGKWRSRVEDKISVFFVNGQDYDDFVEEFKGNIESVCIPENEETVKILSHDEKIRVRKLLFWGEYRWLVIFKPEYGRVTPKTDELDAWIEETYGTKGEDDEISLSNEIRYNYGVSGRRLYLNDEDSLILIKMAFTDIITSVYKCVLEEEVKDALQSYAAIGNEKNNSAGNGG